MSRFVLDLAHTLSTRRPPGRRTGGVDKWVGVPRKRTRAKGLRMILCMADTDDPYYCSHCGVSPCAGLTEDCG